MLMATLTLAAADGPDPIAHVVNHKLVEVNGWWIWSSAQTNLVLSALIMILLGSWIARRIATGPESEGTERYITKNPFAHMIEVMCVYLREQTVRPLLHERTDKMMPFLWCLFFFILINNMLGLVPLLDAQNLLLPGLYAEHKAIIGGTATQSIYVTGVLAIIAGIVINLAGIKELGVGGYIKHLTAGAPVYVWPLMVPIEIAGSMIKPAALAIRLFANMTAGHILLATLFTFVEMGLSKGLGVGIPVGVASFVGVIAVYFLEIFVGFLQAFVFMFLTTVFISLLSHHHEDDHDVEHGYDERTERVAGAAAAGLA